MPYTWQIMASTNQVQIAKLQQQLAKIHQPSYITEKKVDNKNWFTLNIGHYATKAEANKDRLLFADIILKHRPWLKHN